MNLWQEYLVPVSLSEALQVLRVATTPVVPIAGGTDLLLDLEQGRHSPAHTLLDLTSVAEMTLLEMRAKVLYIGAAVPLSRISLDPLVLQHAPALAEACELIGGPQVRNVATLGGNVAHALPAADGTIALLALDSQVEIAGLDGTRLLPIDDLFLGPGKSALKSGEELIVGFHVPERLAHQSSCFKRVMRPQGVALPIVNVAVWLEREAQSIEAVRIAVGPGGPKPWRAYSAERALVGRAMTEDARRLASDALLAEVEFRSSARRASAEYRRHLVVDLVKETLAAAWNRTL
jgi:carbon-monoxide dehydrogenase medium subunit